MAVKTITIDLEAYEALARRKRPGQSFSQVIKQCFTSGSTGRDLLDDARRLLLSEEMLDHMAAQIRTRRRSPARIPRWSSTRTRHS